LLEPRRHPVTPNLLVSVLGDLGGLAVPKIRSEPLSQRERKAHNRRAQSSRRKENDSPRSALLPLRPPCSRSCIANQPGREVRSGRIDQSPGSWACTPTQAVMSRPVGTGAERSGHDGTGHEKFCSVTFSIAAALRGKGPRRAAKRILLVVGILFHYREKRISGSLGEPTSDGRRPVRIGFLTGQEGI
jgi:hypothetical protein